MAHMVYGSAMEPIPREEWPMDEMGKSLVLGAWQSSDYEALIYREAALRSSQGVVDMTVDGECSKCGGCCGRFLPLAQSDLDRLSAMDGTDVEVDLDHGLCPFLVGGRCSVYELRPMICRVYTCRGHRTGEIMADPRNMFLDGAKIVDMVRLVEAVYGNEQQAGR